MSFCSSPVKSQRILCGLKLGPRFRIQVLGTIDTDRRHPRDHASHARRSSVDCRNRGQGVLNRRPVEMPAVLPDAQFGRQAAAPNAISSRSGVRSDSRYCPSSPTRSPEVRAHHPAVIVRQFAVGEDHRRRASSEYRSYFTRPSTFCAVFPWSGLVLTTLPRRFVVGQEQADRRPVSDFAGQRAVARIDSPARHRLQAVPRLINLRPSRKNRTQFRVVDREALVGVDLLRFRSTCESRGCT